MTCQLYLISPPSIDIPDFSEALRRALGTGGVASFQLRLKNTTEDHILKAAEALLPICREYEAAFIMNDSAELAKKSGADGVHLGQDDGSIKAARALLGDAPVIGVSCHDSSHLAMEAGEAGADYVAFGAFYPTQSKSPEALARWGTPTPEILDWWQTFTVLPCVAIGGITPENCGVLVRAGADFLAVITAVWQHAKGPDAAVKEFNEVIAQNLEHRRVAVGG